MKCLILAAGYATRLYPLTENFPKPLLEVRGKTILDWLVDDIESLGVVDGYVVISNHKYYEHFVNWKKAKGLNIEILDDGTQSNETRLGAVRDIQFAIEKLGLDEELLVIAGDNVLDFSLTLFINYALKKQTSAIMRYFEADEARLHKSGVVEVNEEDLILGMVEKPEQPKSNWCCPPFYYYTKSDAALVKEAIEGGCNTDAPGSFIAWLCQKSPVHAYKMPGRRYDIGNLQSYEFVKQNYEGIKIR